MSIDVNVQNDLVIVTESSEDIVVNVSNAAGPQGPAGPAGQGVPVGGSTGQVLKKFTNTNYDTYWAADVSGLSSVGLSMPSGFTVTNSPLTSNGTISVIGAGTTSQYLRGDGSLATFPAIPSGTVTSVDMSVPTGLTISGNPITSAGTLAVGLANGYSIPTTASQATWNTAYNDSIVSAGVTGTTTKTLTLNQQDGGTVTASWTDINTDAVTSVFGRTGAVIAAEGDYTLTQLGDVTLTSPTNGQVLKYNGTTWVNNTDTDTGLTSVGLSMPVAFSVANTPLTANGTLAVSAVGTSAQYIRGDGQLATLPSGAGGGSSVNYYLNGSVNQGTIGGSVYYEMNRTPVIGTGTDFTRTNLQGDGLIAQFITDANDPNRLEIPAGAWNFEMYFNVSSAGGSPAFYLELLKYDGTTFTSIANGSTNPETITGGTAVDLYLTSLAVPQTTLLATDRLAIRVYVITSGRDITLHTEDNNLCEIITTFAGGVASLNGLTANTQYFAVGTTGTDFAISSLSDTHTFNLPTASATNRGALSSADWTIFNNKVGGSGTINYLPKFTGASSIGNSLVYESSGIINVGGQINITTGQPLTLGLQNLQLPTGVASTISAGLSVRTGVANESIIQFGNNLNAYYTGLVDSSRAGAMIRLDTRGVAPIPGASSYSVFQIQTRAAGVADPNYTVPVQIAAAPSGSFCIDINGYGYFYNRLRIGNTTTAPTEALSVTGNGVFSSNVTAASIIKSGGTSSQYLMADGSTSTLTNPVTGTGTTNYLPKWTSGSALGNSAITDDGTTVALLSRALSGSTATFTGSVSATGLFGYILKGRSADNYGAFGFYSNDGITRYGYIQSHSSNGGQLNITGDGGGQIILDNRGHIFSIGSEQMRLTSTGLGIGTTSPAYKLDVTGTGRFFVNSEGLRLQSVDTNGNYITFHNGTGAYGYIGSNYHLTSGGLSSDLGIRSEGNLIFNSGGSTTKMTLNTSGNLLVGTTVDSGERLQVSGSVLATSFIKSGGTSSQYLMADGSVTTGGGGGSVDELQVSLICQVFG